jgi:diadenosine tetraphosphate (Ap4A) HIT family hydrolase
LGLYNKLGFTINEREYIDEDGNVRCKMALSKNGIKKPASFHCHYDRYKRGADAAGCPVCTDWENPNPPVLIKELEYSWVECYEKAQGRLFGKIHVLSKVHSEHFYDMSDTDMQNFMKDIKTTAKALHEVTGAVKVNYEIHGNSMPHLHVHLFPRYLDDDFAGAAIDINIYKPSPYDSHEEFMWFIEKMRELI